MSYFRFYATDLMPNGTNTLLVVDREGSVVDIMDDALFGVNVMPENLGAKLAVIDESGKVLDGLVKAEAMKYGVEVVRELSIKEVLANVAVSPVNDGSQVIEFVNKYKFWS